MFEGVKNDKLELEALRDQLKRFFDNDFMRTFVLFPPMAKRPKNHKNSPFYDYDEFKTHDCSS
jgi:hypothetical protein